MCGLPAQGTYPGIPDTRVQAEAVVQRRVDKQCSYRPPGTHSISKQWQVNYFAGEQQKQTRIQTRPSSNFGQKKISHRDTASTQVIFYGYARLIVAVMQCTYVSGGGTLNVLKSIIPLSLDFVLSTPVALIQHSSPALQVCLTFSGEMQEKLQGCVQR